MSQRRKPVFILGLGAQKAGTTWLHEYLCQSPRTEPGILKEYHIWDGLTVAELAEFDARDIKRGLKSHLRSFLSGVTGAAPRPYALRQLCQRDPDRYFDYFAGLLEREGKDITADITPSYSALSAGTLARIRDGFDKRGIACKAVFLMRDPVDRCLSAVRMVRRKGQTLYGVDGAASEEEALLSYIGTDHARLRTDYPATLTAINAVFDSADTHVGIYETMFSLPEVDRFSAFAGIEPLHGFVKKRYNTNDRTAELSPDTIAAAAEAFAPVYDHCLTLYPDLAERWTGAKALRKWPR